MSAPRAAYDRFLGLAARLPIQPSIRILSGRCGLFGDVFMSLSGIQECARLGFSGSIEWGGRSLYFDPADGRNVHSQLFSNSEFSFSERKVARHIALPYLPYADDIQGFGGERPRMAAKRLIDQFAAPRADIMRHVDEFMRAQLPPSNVLGVHIRRTDAASGFEDRKAQPPSNFLAETAKWLSERENGMIFLATDDEDVVDLFRNQFGPKLVCQNAIRSGNGLSIHGHLDQGTAGSPRQKAYEALFDALVLSRCDFIIRCFSFLTCYSLCINPQLQFLDLDKQNLGVVRTRWLHL